MKILFLDVDGVLNHRGVYGAGNPALLCPAALEQLFRVIEVTGCSVVLSSTWRTLPGLVDKLPERLTREHFHGDWRTIELPFTKTPGGVIIPSKRGEEVDEWLSRHTETERCAIVDDDNDFLDYQQRYFVQTSFDTGGLMPEHADRLIAILLPTARADAGADIVMKHTNIAGTS